MTTREKIEVMEAFERGEAVEIKDCNGNWNTLTIKQPEFRWQGDNYRIKSEQKQVVVIEKWLLQKEGTQQFAIEEGNSVEMAVWDKSSFKKVKLIDTYEVEL